MLIIKIIYSIQMKELKLSKNLFFDLKLNKKKLIIISFSTLTTELCKNINQILY